MKPLVSILIPTFNSGPFIRETLSSAVNQTIKNIEIIVVDNRSTDNTFKLLEEIARRDDRVKIFQNENNIGPVNNWLRCVSLAEGKFAKFLWSDDLIKEDFLEETLKHLKPNVGFVFSDIEILDNETILKKYYPLGKSRSISSNLYLLKSIFNRGTPVSPGCAIFRLSDIKENLKREIPNKQNLEFSKLAIGNDLLLMLITARKYEKVVYTAYTKSVFRSHKNSISLKTNPRELIYCYTIARSYFVRNYFRILNYPFKLYALLLFKKYRRSEKLNINSFTDLIN
jgi:glycosyltransferase involved in cell wall biosynthesis